MAKARPTTSTRTGSSTRARSSRTGTSKSESTARSSKPSFPPPTLLNKLSAEFLGTFVLVFGGVGAALFAAGFVSPQPVQGAPLNIGFLGVALAFGLTVLVMCFAVGHISGGHFNCAVTIGLAVSGRFPWRHVLAYIVTQIVAAIAAAAVLYAILHGKPDWTGPGSFASNGFGPDGSPGGYSMLSGLIIEIVLTAVFLFVILGSTDKRGVPKGFAPIAIGLCLTLIHLIAIPVTNTSVNPARSIGPAIMAAIGGNTTPVSQLWLFIVAPIVGALIAGLSYRSLLGKGH